MLNEFFSFPDLIFERRPSTHKIAALTVMPLTTMKAQATAELYAFPVKTSNKAGTAKDGGIAERTSNETVNDSLIDAMIM